MSYVERRTLRMSPAEEVAYLQRHQWGRLATVSPEGEPHVTPVGYVFLAGRIYFHGLVRSRRGRHIAQGSRLCLCVDDGVDDGQGYRERRGVVVYGDVRVLGPEDRDLLARVRDHYAERFFGRTDIHYERRTHAWYELTPDRTTSWDFSKIPRGADRFSD